MSRIRVLDENMCNRIAAGEVIERPASVVKELVENSIDSGASSISVAIERGGTRLIRVRDDGCGMDSDDAMLCLEPHGTSKINNESDLVNLSTLGFRGEALPSIASVSRFMLRTSQRGAQEGSEVKVEGGKFIELVPGPAAPGTEVEVKDLFFNTPARRKFLRSQSTEEHHIEEILLNLALCYPRISFSLSFDGRVAFSSAGSRDGSLSMRLREFFGRAAAGMLLPVEHRENNMHIYGYTAEPGYSRPSRQEQRTFVNGRKVESPALYQGLREGYSTLAERGRYFPCVIFLEMPGDMVDVNVHPAKREVRFRNDFAVSRAVAAAVSRALKNRGRNITENLLYPSPDEITENHQNNGKVTDHAVIPPQNNNDTPDKITEKDFSKLPDYPLNGGKISLAAAFQAGQVNYRATEQKTLFYPENPAEKAVFHHELIDSKTKPDKTEKTENNAAENLNNSLENRNNGTGISAPPANQSAPLYRELKRDTVAFDGVYPEEIFGVLDDSYIVGAAGKNLVLIDQHAAHERILFERITDQAAKHSAASQRLLLPVTVELPISQSSLLLKNLPLFQQLGFEIESLGGTTLLISALPADFTGDAAGILLDATAELVSNAAAKIPVNLEYAARAACKAAVKSHDKLSMEGARGLVKELQKCRQGTLCPHGRPTIINITMSEIIRRFGRK